MFSTLFRRLKERAPAHGELPPPMPEVPVEIVGDVHGRADLVDRLPPRADDAMRIYVGDIVDRGPDSKGVIDRLRAQEAEGHCLILLGNHEAMLLEFLDDPVALGRRWLRNGGVQTLASYGIGPVDLRLADEDLSALSLRFREALGPEVEAWLRDRPTLWQSGTLAVVHAALDPNRSIGDQPEPTLIWGHADFLQKTPRDGFWVVHGHTIFDHPSAENGRIAVDTGAYMTGRLTLAKVSPDGSVEFVVATAA